MHIIKRKKLILKDYVLYDSNYLKFWKSQNKGDNKISFVALGQWGGERDE